MIRILFILVVLTGVLSGCDPAENITNIPNIPFQTQVNLNDIDFQRLRQPNGYALLPENEAGYKGVIIYTPDGSSTYYAFERACTFDPTEPCETVEVDDSELFLVDKCCGSTFDWNGNVQGGPAQRQLLRYNIARQNNILIISNN